jgi:CelD/BcsL family acetyltransferase involved in cellulose biosynthesis
MHISLVSPDMLDSTQIERWRSIQSNNPELVSPYFCPEFFLLVASVRDDIYVGVIRECDEIKGFFPFQKSSRFSAGPIGGPLSDYHGLIIENGYDIDAREMLRQCGLKSWKFNHLIASQSTLQRYHESIDFSYLIDLSEGLDHYLEYQRNCGSKLMSTVSRKRRKIEREVGPISFFYHTADENVLSKMFEWKSQQYRLSGHMDAFSFKWSRKLIKNICSTQSEGFSGVLSALFVDNNLIAVHMGMRSDEIWHWWFPAYNPEYAKYSPGSILLMEMVQAAPKQKIKMIDLGKGRSRYKDQFNNRQIELAEGSISLRRFPGKIKLVGESIANLIRRTPLVVPARIPAKIIRKYRKWKEFS